MAKRLAKVEEGLQSPYYKDILEKNVAVYQLVNQPFELNGEKHQQGIDNVILEKILG